MVLIIEIILALLLFPFALAGVEMLFAFLEEFKIILLAVVVLPLLLLFIYGVARLILADL